MLLSIPPTNDGAFELPECPDGAGLWPYAALDAAGTLHLAETATEMVAAGLPGYTGIDDDDEALYARYDSLVELAEVLQNHLASQACADGRWDPSEADEDELSAVYGPRDTPSSLATWAGVVPLVAVATDYQPFTDRPAPSGRIIWVDPSSELSYLRSLHTIGVIELFVRGEAAAAVS